MYYMAILENVLQYTNRMSQNKSWYNDYFISFLISSVHNEIEKVTTLVAYVTTINRMAFIGDSQGEPIPEKNIHSLHVFVGIIQYLQLISSIH